jgi:hypothetical protein
MEFGCTVEVFNGQEVASTVVPPLVRLALKQWQMPLGRH